MTLGILAFLVTSLYSVAMIAKNSEPLEVMTLLETRSISHSDEETFRVDLYLNTLHSMYIYDEAMITHTLRDRENETVLPITLKKTGFLESREGMDVLRLTYALDIEASSEPLYLKQASLHIEYSDETTLSVPIGEFSYLFETESSPSLDYMKSTPIKGDYGYGDTVVGHCLELANKSEQALIIKDVSLNVSSIKPNLDYLIPYEAAIHPLVGLDTLMDASFNPKSPSLAPKQHTLQKETSATLCVPFAFEEAMTLKRYAIRLDYLEGTTVKTLNIDDFAYMDSGLSSEQGVKGVGVFVED